VNLLESAYPNCLQISEEIPPRALVNFEKENNALESSIIIIVNAFYNYITADPSGRAVEDMDRRPLACWDCGFKSRQGERILSRLSVMCCQVVVSASGSSLVQRSPTECGVSECDRESSTMTRPWPTGGCCAVVKKLLYN